MLFDITFTFVCKNTLIFPNTQIFVQKNKNYLYISKKSRTFAAVI